MLGSVSLDVNFHTILINQTALLQAVLLSFFFFPFQLPFTRLLGSREKKELKKSRLLKIHVFCRFCL